MKRSYLTALAIAAAVILWLASGWISGGQTAQPKAKSPAKETEMPQVRTRDMRARDKTRELVLFGRTEAARTVVLRAQTAGRVAAIPLDKGRTAKNGDVLVRLAPEDRPARLKEFEAAVEHAQIAYEASQKLSKEAFRSKIQLAENKAQLASARARLATIREDIHKTAIRAPFDGVVNDVGVEVGDYLKIGDPVATVIDLDPMLVVAEIAEGTIARLAKGGAAQVTIAGLGTFDGVVNFISRTATPATRTFPIEVSVANPNAVIAEGMTTELHLSGETVRAHLLSPAVLTLSDEGVVGVKTVNGDDVVEFHPVRIIADTPEGMWVSGLGDRVRAVTVGQEFVRAGQKVRTVPEKTGAN